jgi:hypothetical protein
MKSFLTLLFLCCLIVSCSDRDTRNECVFQPEVSNIQLDFKFEQFEDSLPNIKSKAEVVALMKRQPFMRDYIFSRTSYPNDSAFIDELYQKFTNPHFDSLLLETKRVFSDGSALRKQFQEAFTNIKYYYPDFVAPKVQTTISGLTTDLFVSDTLIIVSLDYYLGDGAKYRPQMYQYLLRRYGPEDIVPSCMLLYGIGENFNKTNLADKSVLADMIAYGKSFYFAKHMLPCTPDSVFLWYTVEEMKGARENEDLIWARFLQDKVVFSTNMIDKRNYLGERPFTVQVGEKCPGRIGQWVGWQIVKQYMINHDEVQLPELMNSENAQMIFKESRYKPKA